ncbi:RING finger protein 121 [Gryllus bimaculatus]|nr:RING finger protein 121 [Gryllus bimaculatus]
MEMENNNNENRSIEELTPEEKWRREHMKLHEQHRGHDTMHAEMVLILLVTLVVAQIVLVEWKKRHFKSYQFISLLGMWIIPLVMCLRNQWWRFIFFWLLFSCITGFIVRKAVQKPIEGTTPRLVYKWFYFLYKLSYALGLIGYFILCATFFGLNLVFDAKPQSWVDVGVLFLFYGLYYGVLGRDVAEICADTMASHVGYYTAQGMPTRHLESGVCAVCGNRLLVAENEEGVLENTYKLSCNHVYPFKFTEQYKVDLQIFQMCY